MSPEGAKIRRVNVEAIFTLHIALKVKHEQVLKYAVFLAAVIRKVPQQRCLCGFGIFATRIPACVERMEVENCP